MEQLLWEPVAIKREGADTTAAFQPASVCQDQGCRAVVLGSPEGEQQS